MTFQPTCPLPNITKPLSYYYIIPQYKHYSIYCSYLLPTKKQWTKMSLKVENNSPGILSCLNIQWRGWSKVILMSGNLKPQSQWHVSLHVQVTVADTVTVHYYHSTHFYHGRSRNEACHQRLKLVYPHCVPFRREDMEIRAEVSWQGPSSLLSQLQKAAKAQLSLTKPHWGWERRSWPDMEVKMH